MRGWGRKKAVTAWGYTHVGTDLSVAKAALVMQAGISVNEASSMSAHEQQNYAAKQFFGQDAAGSDPAFPGLVNSFPIPPLATYTKDDLRKSQGASEYTGKTIMTKFDSLIADLRKLNSVAAKEYGRVPSSNIVFRRALCRTIFTSSVANFGERRPSDTRRLRASSNTPRRSTRKTSANLTHNCLGTSDFQLRGGGWGWG